MKAKLVAEKSINNFSSKSSNNKNKKRVRYEDECSEKKFHVDQEDGIVYKSTIIAPHTL